jgi:hypothetical protein
MPAVKTFEKVWGKSNKRKRQADNCAAMREIKRILSEESKGATELVEST